MKAITADHAPKAIGPYCHAVKTGNLLFCSGQVPLDPQTMQVVGDTIEEQTKQVFQNISAVLAAEGLALQNVVKSTVFLSNMDNFKGMNGVYADEFGNHKPSRSAVEVARLPLGVLVEIECIAEIPA